MTNSSTWIFYLVVEYGMEFIKQELELCSLLFNLMPQDNKLERERGWITKTVYTQLVSTGPAHIAYVSVHKQLYFITELYFLRSFL